MTPRWLLSCKPLFETNKKKQTKKKPSCFLQTLCRVFVADCGISAWCFSQHIAVSGFCLNQTTLTTVLVKNIKFKCIHDRIMNKCYVFVFCRIVECQHLFWRLGSTITDLTKNDSNSKMTNQLRAKIHTVPTQLYKMWWTG